MDEEDASGKCVAIEERIVARQKIGVASQLEMDLRELQKENKRLRKELDERQVDFNNTYLLLSENVRLRRMMEIMDEERILLEKKVAAADERAEKAARGLKNLQKWLEIDGYTGLKKFGKVSDR